MHNMFETKTLVMAENDVKVEFGANIPESAREGLTEAVYGIRSVQAEVGAFARRSLNSMVRFTDGILRVVASTEGLSKDAAFIEVSRNVAGLTKPSLDKWGQTANRLRALGLTTPTEWTDGAVSASYALTGSGYGPAKDALKGVTVGSSDEAVEAIAQAINNNPQVKAVKAAPKSDETTVADVTDAPLNLEAFGQSVLALVAQVDGDVSNDDLAKSLKAIAQTVGAKGYARV